LGYLRYVYAKRGEIAVAISYYLFLVTFLAAYIRPSHSVMVTIDAYNEVKAIARNLDASYAGEILAPSFWFYGYDEDSYGNILETISSAGE
jgi:hypothetical protein